jgi:hypothetical protein
MAGQSKHQVILTITGESTGVVKAANSGREALQRLATAIQSVVEKTQSSSTVVDKFRNSFGQFTNATKLAKQAVAQINAEEAKRVAIENQLIATLTKEEVAVLRKNGLMRQQAAIVHTVTTATDRFKTAIETASASTSIWSSRLQAFKTASGQTVSILQSARAAVSQLTQEKRRAIQIEQMLVNALSVEDVALLRNAGLMTSLTVVTQENTKAKIQNAQANQKNANSMGAASFALTSLGQTFADAGQFGMGAAQGIRAITNNVQQFAFAFIFLRLQLGSYTLALKGLWAALSGPLSILFAFQAITGAMEAYSNLSQRVAKRNREQRGGVDDLTKAYKELLKVIPDSSPMGRTVLTSAVEERISVIKREILALKNAASSYREALGSIAGSQLDQVRLTNAAALSIAEFTKELKLLEEQLPASTKEAEKFLGFITKFDELNAKARGKENEYLKRIKELSDELQLAGQHSDFVDMISDLEDALAAGLSGDPAKAIGELNKEYGSFRSQLAAVNPELEVSRKEFAKMFGEGKAGDFIKAENTRLLTKELAELTKKTGQASSEADKLHAEWEKILGVGMKMSRVPSGPPEKLLPSRAMQSIIEEGERYAEAQNKIVDANQALRDSFAALGADLIISAATIGGGTEAMTRVFGRFFIKYGSELVKMGVATALLGVSMKAVREALQSFNGVPAIVAGAALVAAGSALSRQAKKSSKALGGGGSASTPNFNAAPGFGQRTPASVLGPPSSLGLSVSQNITGTFYASGRDLVAVVGAETSSQQAMGIKNPLRISNN